MRRQRNYHPFFCELKKMCTEVRFFHTKQTNQYSQLRTELLNFYKNDNRPDDFLQLDFLQKLLSGAYERFYKKYTSTDKDKLCQRKMLSNLKNFENCLFSNIFY